MNLYEWKEYWNARKEKTRGKSTYETDEEKAKASKRKEKGGTTVDIRSSQAIDIRSSQALEVSRGEAHGKKKKNNRRFSYWRDW